MCLIDWCFQKPEWIAFSCSVPDALQRQLPLLHVIIFLFQQCLRYLGDCPYYSSNGSIHKLIIILVNLFFLI